MFKHLDGFNLLIKARRLGTYNLISMHHILKFFTFIRRSMHEKSCRKFQISILFKIIANCLILGLSFVNFVKLRKPCSAMVFLNNNKQLVLVWFTYGGVSSSVGYGFISPLCVRRKIIQKCYCKSYKTKSKFSFFMNQSFISFERLDQAIINPSFIIGIYVVFATSTWTQLHPI